MITVVIPVWDEYVTVIRDAVESVLAQDTQVELVIVDNASSEPIPVMPPRVEAVRLPGRVSVGAARNAGLAVVQTEFVLFLDADDVIAPGTLALLLSRMRARPGFSACSCGIVAWNASTGRTCRLDFPTRTTRVMARWPGGFRIYAVLANRMPTTGCVLIRTALARDAGGFTDSDFAEDWALNAALAFRGRIEFLSRPGRLLRVHAQSLRARPRTRAEVARAVELVRERLKADPASPAIVHLGFPLIAFHHTWQLRRATPGGTTGPGAALQAVGDGGLLPTVYGGGALERRAAVEGV